MRSVNYLGLVGSLLLIAGWLSPMLHLPIIGNWNYWDLDVTLASIVMVLALLGIVASVVNKPGLIRFSGWAALIMILITMAGVYFKIHDSFSFIPFKKLAAAATRIVHYRYTGWILLVLGSIMLIVGGGKRSRPSNNTL
ncbi:MAG: hypothetical protein H7Y07_10120 [Pyrinomonadaceae bacterium]|nr:hypothetical protein [Sphingobacteriaceae bacterium]